MSTFQTSDQRKRTADILSKPVLVLLWPRRRRPRPPLCVIVFPSPKLSGPHPRHQRSSRPHSICRARLSTHPHHLHGTKPDLAQPSLRPISGGPHFAARIFDVSTKKVSPAPSCEGSAPRLLQSHTCAETCLYRSLEAPLAALLCLFSQLLHGDQRPCVVHCNELPQLLHGPMFTTFSKLLHDNPQLGRLSLSR